ncbi:MAG: hypothetical protein AAB592_00025 [Patescibacteria group bacterium]
MRKFAAQLALIIVLMSLAVGTYGAIAPIARAEDPLDAFTEIIDKTGLPRFEGRPHPDSSIEPGADVVTTVIFQVIDFAKYLLGGLAIIFLVIGGVKLITAGGDIEEVSDKEEENLKYVLYGLGLTIIADVLVKQVIFGEYGECYASETNAESCAKAGAFQVRGIYNFIEVFLGTIAVLMFVLAGFRLATSAGDEEVVNQQKNRIGAAIVGIILVAFSELVVKEIIFPEFGGTTPDSALGQETVFRLINFIASFVATIAVIIFLYGGYTYVMSAGNDDAVGNAKKILIGGVIGVLISFAAFGVVRSITRIEGREGEPAATVIERSGGQ